MGRTSVAALVGLAIVFALASPAAAQVLTPAPLPGSTFQGGDGDHADDSGLIDWQGLEAADRVIHKSDAPNADDSAFARGNALEPYDWEFTTANNGVTPGESNIRDAWSSIEERPSPTEPGTTDVFLYLAFTNNGVQRGVVSFEFNRDDRLWRNDRGARVPCRHDGDLMIAYATPGGGEPAEIRVHRWVTIGPEDADSGCARQGEFVRVALPAGAAQFAMNVDDPIPNYLPRDPALTGDVPRQQFGEASLNLSAVIRNAFPDDPCFAYTSVWMWSRPSFSYSAALKDFVEPQSLDLRKCTASGVKFFDSNANGRRNRGERGIPRIVIWADYDNDGVQDDNEPFSVTDRRGRYVIHDIRPTNAEGTYWLRERPYRSGSLLARRWRCSYPNDSTPGGTGSAPGRRLRCAWGPINAEATPNAKRRNFGNWFPAVLTVSKRLVPATDPGRFDLFVGTTRVLAGAGDGARATRFLVPGTYTVSERAVTGTNPDDFDSSVRCRRVTGLGRLRSGVESDPFVVRAGQVWSCKFVNARIGEPVIEIVKSGPETATAGDTLRFKLLVTNPGDISFPRGDITVADTRCDGPPRRVSTRGDASPDSLDPGDEWVYRCSHATAAPGSDCEETTFTNRSTVVVEDPSVTDDDSHSTILLCPDQPGPPVPIEPDVPDTVVPPGPRPPDAGDAGRVRAAFARATQRCLRTHVPRVDLSGTRIARVRIFVNGRLRRGLNVRTLQSRVRPRVTLARGSYRVVARVTFELGSGTPPITLARTVEICPPRAAAPNFTG